MGFLLKAEITLSARQFRPLEREALFCARSGWKRKDSLPCGYKTEVTVSFTGYWTGVALVS